MVSNRLVRKWMLLGLVLLVTSIVGGVGIAYAAGALSSPPGSLIQACADSQHLRIVTSPSNCKKAKPPFLGTRRATESGPSREQMDSPTESLLVV